MENTNEEISTSKQNDVDYIFELFEEMINLKIKNVVDYMDQIMNPDELNRHADNIYYNLLNHADLAYIKMKFMRKNLYKE